MVADALLLFFFSWVCAVVRVVGGRTDYQYIELARGGGGWPCGETVDEQTHYRYTVSSHLEVLYDSLTRAPLSFTLDFLPL
jgi:hypothetical protein